MVWTFGWVNLSTPEAQHIYCIELNREVGLLHTDKQGDRSLIHGWIKETHLVNLCRNSLYREVVFRAVHMVEGEL